MAVRVQQGKDPKTQMLIYTGYWILGAGIIEPFAILRVRRTYLNFEVQQNTAYQDHYVHSSMFSGVFAKVRF